jgi:hypothetical protein
MRIALLDKLTGEWAKPWIIIWFTAGVAALFTTFWRKLCTVDSGFCGSDAHAYL